MGVKAQPPQTGTLKLSNIWQNLRQLITAAKKTDVKMHLKLLDGATFDNMKRPEYQAFVLNTAIDLFMLRPGLFGYTLNEIEIVTAGVRANRPKTVADMKRRLDGQYNDNGVFFGEQPKFTWRRGPRIADQSASFPPERRPYNCYIESLPGYHFTKDGFIGGLLNHGWGFTNVGNEWYSSIDASPKSISFARMFEFGDDKEARKNFEKLFVSIIYGWKFPEFREQIMAKKSLISLKL
jgi:hypothetical protein